MCPQSETVVFQHRSGFFIPSRRQVQRIISDFRENKINKKRLKWRRRPSRTNLYLLFLLNILKELVVVQVGRAMTKAAAAAAATTPPPFPPSTRATAAFSARSWLGRYRLFSSATSTTRKADEKILAGYCGIYGRPNGAGRCWPFYFFFYLKKTKIK